MLDGNATPVGLPVAGAEGDVAAPLDADVARVLARGLDDARLDEHLRRSACRASGSSSSMWLRLPGDVARDEHVGALVDRDRAARREQLLGARLELVGLRVADRG